MKMKIVKIAHDRPENRQARTYLFRTDRDLKTGQMVLTETCHGMAIGWVREDSIVAQDKTVSYICGTDDVGPYMPIQRVVGVIELFGGDDNEID
jgi:hypothetical protein